MKTYNNGPRKGMMYSGAARRKPMMYGGMAKSTKPRKKAQMGGMMSASPDQMAQDKRQQDMMMNTTMSMPRTGTGMMYGGMAKKKKR